MRYIRSLILSVLSLLGSFPLLAQSSNESPYLDVAQSFYRNDQLDSATYYARQAIASSSTAAAVESSCVRTGLAG